MQRTRCRNNANHGLLFSLNEIKRREGRNIRRSNVLLIDADFNSEKSYLRVAITAFCIISTGCGKRIGANISATALNFEKLLMFTAFSAGDIFQEGFSCSASSAEDLPFSLHISDTDTLFFIADTEPTQQSETFSVNYGLSTPIFVLNRSSLQFRYRPVLKKKKNHYSFREGRSLKGKKCLKYSQELV